MASTFSNLGLELQTTGENANTWGDKTNVNLELIDERLSAIGAITNTSSFSLPAPSNATKSVNNGAATLKFTGSASAEVVVTMPAKTLLYNVINSTGQNLKFKCSTETTTATIKNGQNGTIHSDGSANVYLISTVANDFDNDVTIKTNDGAILKLQTGDTDIAQDNTLGAIEFQAPDETTGTDAIVAAGRIEVASEGDFSATNNAATIYFKTGEDGTNAGTPLERFRITSTGASGILKDGSTSTNHLFVGAGYDLKIYHDGSDSYVDDTGTGNLNLKGSAVQFLSTGGESMIKATTDGAAELYHDGTKKIETTSAGTTVSGVVTATGFTIGSAVIAESELEQIDGITAGTVSASKVVVVDSNKDASGFRNVTATGTVQGAEVTATSDERLKSDIKTIDNALDKVMNMRGVSFTKQAERGIGVIAQEVEKVLPEVVHDGDYKSVAYGNMVGVLIEAIKELKTEIDTHKQGCKCHAPSK